MKSFSEQPIGFLLRLWLMLCATCTIVGWGLSLAHQLNWVSYGIIAFIGLGFLIWQWEKNDQGAQTCRRLLRFYKRVWGQGEQKHHWLPKLWLLNVIAAGVGGMIYPPNNYDGLTYRFPRVLQWMAENQWHWIHTPNERMNYSACGFEWLMTALFAVTRTDRLFFLLNLIPYLLMPTLLFSILRRLGVQRRVAWCWMWLLPGGYCFLLQAGSIGNDAVATVFLLASIRFALAASDSGGRRSLSWSILAAALLTNIKASNLPLFLPWAVACWPARRLFLSPKIWAVALLAASVSFVPQAMLNQHYAGHWNGSETERKDKGVHDSLSGILGNTLQLTVQNLNPPVNPTAKKISQTLTDVLPEAWSARLKRDFPRFTLDTPELPQEESAGVGFGIGLLVGVGLLAACIRIRREGWRLQEFVCKQGVLIGIGTGGALLFFMTQLGSEATARLITPYYPLLLLPLLFLPGQAWLAFRRPWQLLALGVSVLASLVLALTPSRSLWPAKTVWRQLAAHHPRSQLLQRAVTVYATYGKRSDSLSPLRRHFPPDVINIGLLSCGDEPDVALWRPLGRRRVWHLLKADLMDLLQHRHISVLVVQSSLYHDQPEAGLQEILTLTQGRLLARESIRLKASQDSEEWWVLALPSGM